MNSPITKLKFCHYIFALSLTRFAFRNPNGITCGYAAFDLLLQNSSITKRCFVILSKAKNLNQLCSLTTPPNRNPQGVTMPRDLRPVAAGAVEA